MPGTTPAAEDALVAVLREAVDLGFLGPGPVERHLQHAGEFLAVLRPARRILDLGSGGGVPGLALAARLPATELILLDARQTRTDFLQRAVRRLGWAERVTVLTERAEVTGRDPVWRATLDAVVARSFADPATTAECAAPFLRTGGQLLVSEPPNAARDRWPPEGLALVGLARDDLSNRTVVSFTQVTPCPGRFPRRRLAPALFHVERPQRRG